ncbi:MAG: DNA-binding response regulator, partial [Actinobacteria bacterium ATB1]|nr:DNA-binding response regulator [Actinobacteria bacterium ATB1]
MHRVCGLVPGPVGGYDDAYARVDAEAGHPLQRLWLAGPGEARRGDVEVCRVNQHRILLVDDHALLRAGVRRLLEDEDDMEVVGEAADGVSAVEEARRVKPDVAVVDLTLPKIDGVEVTRRINADLPGTKVLVLTMHEEPAFVERVLSAGAAGYLLKRTAEAELIRAIRAVSAGEGFVDSGVTRSVLAHFTDERGDEARGRLSPRELQVLTLVAWGYTSSEIAGQLVISAKTVESHKSRVMDKLGLRTRAQL